MPSQNATQAELEAALKAILLRLSHILAFQARLQQQGTAQYAPPAPRRLTQQLTVDVAKFDVVCDEVERKLLRAIAVIERDVRKATGASPLPVLSPEQATVKAEPGAETVLPFGLPSSATDSAAMTGLAAAAMSIDLTNSPSPTASSLRFQLPGAATPADAAASNSNAAPSAQMAATSETAAADDLNALLSSLNVPPFGSIDTSANSTSTSNPPDQSFTGSVSFPDLSLEALDSLLGGSAAGSGTSAPPASSSLSADLGSLGLDFSSTLSAPTQPSATAAPASSSAPSHDLGTFDFSILGLAGSTDPTVTSGVGGTGGLGNLDMTGLGDLDLGSFVAQGGGQDGGTDAVDLDELLKSLGGQ
ncbi:proteophosphoglycan 5 [Rhodotorula toruloides]|uniref:Proteophosphoglycan 5 n=1 Tax=Rhodotorula toruloides TaxID=5286 RepID=A0A511KLQ3_RHOTO|nr:proteophosphoglycan 5 [Rhodotorula toruloides]